MHQPNHIAIIMDGNGRWAQARGRDRTYGHIRGAFVAKKIITAASNNKIPHLTLFAFSTENWHRPANEVHFLMRLLRHQIIREQRSLMKNNIRFQVVGDISRLPDSVKLVVEETILMTQKNSGLVLTFGLNYGGRQEITAACKKIAELTALGKVNPAEIDESFFASALPSADMPDPDLIIRTSGEKRISNFMLWQSAYSELYFTDIQWPDFNALEFERAIDFYTKRKRRFGRVNDSSQPISLGPNP